MDAYHRGDWFGFGQAVGTVAAIFATIGLYWAQRRRDVRRDRRRKASIRRAVDDTLRLSITLAEEAHEPGDRFKEVGTWSQYKIFRKRQLDEYLEILASLPVEDLAETDLLGVALSVRVCLRNLNEIIFESEIDSPESWPYSRNMILDCLKSLHRSQQALKTKS